MLGRRIASSRSCLRNPLTARSTSTSSRLLASATSRLSQSILPRQTSRALHQRQWRPSQTLAKQISIQQRLHQQSRAYATIPDPAVAVQAGKIKKSPGRMYRYLIRTFATCGFVVIVFGGLIVGLFAYDATTYKEEIDAGDCPVPQLALSPEIGGPKKLPIARYMLDDEDCDEKMKLKDKPRIVVLGCGWGSVALLKTLAANQYHVTVVSPSNYFLFTPFLPSATVGTLELRSLVEPIRKIIARIKGHFIQGDAIGVEFSEKLVEISQEIDGERRNFYLPYDKLIVGVGSCTNTHGVDGLENCEFLKTIDDARKIRNKVITNFERAVLPTTTDEERKKLLSFVVCGGGPTGVEFAAELYDILNEDLVKQYPRLLRNEVSVHVIQSRSHILNTYDEALSRFAEEHFARDDVDVQINARVIKVEKDKIIFSQKADDGTVVTKEIPYGLCLWSTGVAQTEFAKNLTATIEKQTNKHALETDTHLRLIGAPLGDVYALGDCATVQNNLSDYIVSFLRDLAWEKGRDPEKVALTFKDWQTVAGRVKKRFPQATDHLRKLDKLFDQYDTDHSGTLDFDELKELLKQIDNRLTSLPATAQRAHQQGQYLGKKLNKLAQAAPGMKANELLDGDLDEAYYKAFEYKHLGSLAYIGNGAIFDINGLSFQGGILAVYLWRGAYFAQSVSLRTRFLLAMDWSKRALFGRDLMSL